MDPRLFVVTAVTAAVSLTDFMDEDDHRKNENDDLLAIETAIALLEDEIENSPGRGHPWFEKPIRRASIPNVNFGMIHWILQEPGYFA